MNESHRPGKQGAEQSILQCLTSYLSELPCSLVYPNFDCGYAKYAKYKFYSSLLFTLLFTVVLFETKLATKE